MNDPDVKVKPLNAVPFARRKSMCLAAKVEAKLDGMVPPKDDVFSAFKYTFILPNGDQKELIAMRCSTIPVSYLYFTYSPYEVTWLFPYIDQVQNELTILLKENEYKSYKYSFILEKVKSNPELVSGLSLIHISEPTRPY